MIVLRVAARQIEVAPDIRHPDDARIDLLDQIDDPTFFERVVDEPRTRTWETVEMPALEATSENNAPNSDAPRIPSQAIYAIQKAAPARRRSL